MEREGLVNGYANVRKGDRLTLKYISTKAMFTNYGLVTYCTHMCLYAANILSFFYVNVCYACARFLATTRPQCRVLIVIVFTECSSVYSLEELQVVYLR